MATWGAGQRITAGKLASYSTLATLADRTVGTTEATWGANVSLANPGVDVAVHAILTGGVFNGGSGKIQITARLDISTDNGANWSNGQQIDVTVEPSGVTGVDREMVTCIHRAQALPTGTVLVRARVSATTSSGAEFRQGSIMAWLVGV